MRAHVYAGILLHLSTNLETMELPAGCSTETIRSAFNAILPKGTVPEFSDAVKPPVSGPLRERGECDMERFSQTNALLKSTDCALAPTRWVDMFCKGLDPLLN